MTTPTRRGPSPALTIFVLLIAAAAPAAGQTDLGPLFAAPSSQEISEVSLDWSHRQPTSAQWTMIRSGTDSGTGMQVAAFSQQIDGFTQYGALRYPTLWRPGGKYPVLVLLHGGFDGLTQDYLVNFDADFPGDGFRDSFLVVGPTFRGEPLNGDAALGYHLSGGAPSPFDHDCDDAMAVLTAVLQNVSGADASYVVVLGGSRGGNVAYHMAMRDPRVRRTAIRYGPTDFFLDHIRQGCQEMVDTGSTGDVLGMHVADDIAIPWLQGQLTLSEARHLLLAWSPALLLSGTVPLQIHHGELDDVVPIIQSATADSIMTAKGATSPDYAYYVYPLGGHTPTSLSGHEQRVLDYLTGLPTATGVGGSTPRATTLRASPNPFADETVLVLSGPFAGGKSAGDAPVLDIYDLRGRTVRTLPLGASAGAFAGRWDGRDAEGRRLPAGVYFAAPDGRAAGNALKIVRIR